LVAGSLVFSGADLDGNFVVRHTRLAVGDGLEYWFGQGEIDGVVRDRRLQVVVKAPEARLDTTKAARRWLIPGSPGQFNPSESASQEALHSNGSWVSTLGNTSVGGASRTWRLSPDGLELDLLNNGFSLAYYQIVAAFDGGYLAYRGPRLVRLRDLGPAD
jgi:hypothetical protein